MNFDSNTLDWDQYSLIVYYFQFCKRAWPWILRTLASLAGWLIIYSLIFRENLPLTYRMWRAWKFEFRPTFMTFDSEQWDIFAVTLYLGFFCLIQSSAPISFLWYRVRESFNLDKHTKNIGSLNKITFRVCCCNQLNKPRKNKIDSVL
jgi:hypothetical protein